MIGQNTRSTVSYGTNKHKVYASIVKLYLQYQSEKKANFINV